MTTPIPRQRARAQAHNLPVYVSVDEAATMMSLSPKTIRRWIGEGTIPAYRCGRRHIRIRLEDLEMLLRRIPSVRK